MWGCFLMSGVKILHFLKDWWKSIPIHQNYTMALSAESVHMCENTEIKGKEEQVKSDQVMTTAQ